MIGWEYLAAALGLVWVACAVLSYVNLRFQGRSRKHWLWLSLLGPIGTLISLFPPRAKSSGPTRPTRQYQDEDFFKRTPPFSFEVRELKKAGRLDEAVDILNILVEEVESRSRRLRRPVPVWYYSQLISIYRKQGRDRLVQKIERRKARFSPKDPTAPQKF